MGNFTQGCCREFAVVVDPLGGGVFSRTCKHVANTPGVSPAKGRTHPVASLLWLEMQQPLAGGFLPLVWLPGSAVMGRLVGVTLRLLLVGDVVPFFPPPLTYQSANGFIPLSFPSALLSLAFNLRARSQFTSCRDPRLLKGTTGAEQNHRPSYVCVMRFSTFPRRRLIQAPRHF